MDNIKENIEGNEALANILSILKMVFRFVLPLIGLGYFTKYLEEDDAAE